MAQTDNRIDTAPRVMQTRQENAGRRLRYVWLVGLLALVFGAGVAGGVVFDRQVVAAFVPLDNIPADAKPAFQRMADAWNTIQQHYVDQSAVQPPQLAYGAIGGMVDARGDRAIAVSCRRTC